MAGFPSVTNQGPGRDSPMIRCRWKNPAQKRICARRWCQSEDIPAVMRIANRDDDGVSARPIFGEQRGKPGERYDRSTVATESAEPPASRRQLAAVAIDARKTARRPEGSSSTSRKQQQADRKRFMIPRRGRADPAMAERHASPSPAICCRPCSGGCRRCRKV